jgi:hypothetical protein
MAATGLVDHLTPMPLVAGAGFFAIIAIIAFAVPVLRGYYRLAHVPGPKLMGYTNLAMAAKMYGGRMHYEMLDMMKKYGASYSLRL